eukprot:4158750-Prymnesium_polylepis.1
MRSLCCPKKALERTHDILHCDGRPPGDGGGAGDLLKHGGARHATSSGEPVAIIFAQDACAP